ncbi:class I SAM-dependent methyltransferase [Actinoplanes utahensis]|uniref:Methyltransferase type 11 domain-containing protein n=1 Tax=Actinoplanes utahensis TaxID=1869 RepID=A0A0A6UAD8_ACTUT|nr:methyltransferase domain-containing protein [Actinoplanes utahensis]KHD72023.1 hypothetical protein MB27_42705 [Actinoplanes utahensis]GIF31620.1 hypothetical protein Aut01nite_46060 [Actinoplanes utahensis]
MHIELDSASAVDGRHLRAVAFNQVRLLYAGFHLEQAGVGPGSRALVVGSVRGDLARGLADLGLAVTAVDPSPAATKLAQERDPSGRVRYRTHAPDALDGGPFDVVYCADTFEVVDDVGAVVKSVAGVLRPDGLLLFDTVNRTVPSMLIYLVAFQRLPMTRIMPPGRYAAARLRPPRELVEILGTHGLRTLDVRGFKPRTISGLVSAVRQRRAGRITDDEVAGLTDFVLEKPGGIPVVTYLGAARLAG